MMHSQWSGDAWRLQALDAAAVSNNEDIHEVGVPPGKTSDTSSRGHCDPSARLAKVTRNEISFSGKCTILRMAMEQYYLLGEDRKDMVAWWSERLKRNEISFSGKCTILRRAFEQYYLLGEDRKEMVAWWYERTLPEREEAFKARQIKEKQLDEWADHVKVLELERQTKLQKQLRNQQKSHRKKSGRNRKGLRSETKRRGQRKHRESATAREETHC